MHGGRRRRSPDESGLMPLRATRRRPCLAGGACATGQSRILRSLPERPCRAERHARPAAGVADAGARHATTAASAHGVTGTLAFLLARGAVAAATADRASPRPCRGRQGCCARTLPRISPPDNRSRRASSTILGDRHRGSRGGWLHHQPAGSGLPRSPSAAAASRACRGPRTGNEPGDDLRRHVAHTRASAFARWRPPPSCRRSPTAPTRLRPAKTPGAVPVQASHGQDEMAMDMISRDPKPGRTAARSHGRAIAPAAVAPMPDTGEVRLPGTLVYWSPSWRLRASSSSRRERAPGRQDTRSAPG